MTKYVNYAYTCTSDGRWEGSDTDAIQSQPFWTTKETSFPIPEGGGPSSTTDPQQTVSQAYNTVLLPMDDGNWHVTVYCPAALDAPLLDKDANELDPDQVKAGDEAYTVISATGYGTVQHPLPDRGGRGRRAEALLVAEEHAMSRTGRHRILAAMLSACLLSLLGGCTPLTVLAVLGGCKDGGSTGSSGGTTGSVVTGEGA